MCNHVVLHQGMGCMKDLIGWAASLQNMRKASQRNHEMKRYWQYALQFGKLVISFFVLVLAIRCLVPLYNTWAARSPSPGVLLVSMYSIHQGRCIKLALFTTLAPIEHLIARSDNVFHPRYNPIGLGYLVLLNFASLSSDTLTAREVSI